MLERLTDTFSGLFRKLSGQANISESNVRDAMADVRKALLEADVHVAVVDKLCESVLSDAVGRDVTKSLTPGQEMIGIVHRRLVELLGGSVDETAESLPGLPAGAIAAPTLGAASPIMKVSPGPTVIMMCGLQGSGKTTTCGKLAAYLKKRGRSVMLAAADLQRPAAVEQLETVSKQVQAEMPGGAAVSFYAETDKIAAYGKAVGVAVGVCTRAVEAARKLGVDVVILDTAGRLHVNDELMGELASVSKMVRPHHVFLVVDAMTGQDAVNSARSFHERLSVDGIILTKFDSDTRGGAALSVKHVTGAPIKFVGVGEKLDAIEEFHPTRFAGRILGMGDVVSLVEKAQEEVSQEDAEKLQNKMAKGQMTMDDFLSQMKSLRRMGPLKQLLGLLPGVGQMMKDVHVDEKQLDRVEAMIHSMTPVERRTPGVIEISRRKRIARGSGMQANDVGQLVKQFESVNKLTSAMASMGPAARVAAVKEMSRTGDGMSGLVPGLQGMPQFRTKGSTVSSPAKNRFKKRK
jgi:signal recognition particle subunit SRP54